MQRYAKSTFWFYAILMVSVISYVSVAHPAERLYDKIAAIVNGKVITLREVVDAMGQISAKWESVKNPQKRKQARIAAYREALESLIDNALIEAEVEKAKIKVTDQEVDAAIKNLMKRSRIDSIERFRAAVESRGFSWNEYREHLRKQIKHRRFLSFRIGRQAKVEEEEVKAEYARRKLQASQKIKCNIGYITLYSEDPKQARDAANEIAQSGANADSLSKMADALNGKDSNISAKYMHSEYELATWSDQMKEVCIHGTKGKVYPKVIEGKNLFVVAALLDKKHDTLPPYEQIRNSIFYDLYAERIEKLTKSYLKSLRKKAVIKIVSPDAEELLSGR